MVLLLENVKLVCFQLKKNQYFSTDSNNAKGYRQFSAYVQKNTTTVISIKGNVA